MSSNARHRGLTPTCYITEGVQLDQNIIDSKMLSVAAVLPCCLLLCSFILSATALPNSPIPGTCRNVPGSPNFPSSRDFATLNNAVSGRLVNVVPFVEFCTTVGGCTLQQFTSSTFRTGVPGAMNQVNWEQDYTSNPPSLCQPESPSTCGQGSVPVLGILAESVSDIQAGVNFARIHNLRLIVKSSGHDYLGRSTAKDSFLISTHKLQNITFSDDFVVGGKSLGPAVTVQSGVALNTMYTETKAQGRYVVGGSAATVAAAGGYVQGAGHSAMSPFLGLAADNCLQFEVVLANGQFVKANAAQNSDLFWAMRGGGAGSWGVIVSATFKSFLTFNATVSEMTLVAQNVDQVVEVATAHAKHIFDWDTLHAGQYFYLSTSGLFDTENYVTHGPGSNIPTMIVYTFFPNATVAQANTTLQAFRNDIRQIAGVKMSEELSSAVINDALFMADDIVGSNTVLGSRLIPATAYGNSTLVGDVYSQLLKQGGAQNILLNLVAGGKVSENSHISNAVHPAWRTAKTHLILANNWPDSATIPQVSSNQTLFLQKQLPILERLSGNAAGAYSNEADPWEPTFQTTFYGPNYLKLSLIKVKYDPTDLFIVKAGVGSERWDSDGICRIVAL